jgi:hypothetical protein
VTPEEQIIETVARAGMSDGWAGPTTRAVAHPSEELTDGNDVWGRIDKPLGEPRDRDSGYELHIAGWVVGRRERVASVTLLHDGIPHWRTESFELRADTERLFPEAEEPIRSGFDVTLSSRASRESGASCAPLTRRWSNL